MVRLCGNASSPARPAEREKPAPATPPSAQGSGESAAAYPSKGLGAESPEGALKGFPLAG